MTRDEIIQMATDVFGVEFFTDQTVPKIIKFAALVSTAEREACANVCEAQPETGAHKRCAAAIRARNEPSKGRD